MRFAGGGGTVVRMERFWLWVDWALAVTLAGVGVIRLATADDRPEGLALVASALVLLAGTLPLGWRRRRPLAALTVISASGVVAVAADDALSGGAEPFLAWLLAVYASAAYADRRRAVAGAAVATGVVAAWHLSQLLRDEPITDLPGLWLLIAATWLVGRVVRWKTMDAARLERESQQGRQAAASAERSRIARELHDVVAHSVSVMVVQAQAAQRVLEGDQASARESLDTIEHTGRQALVELRRLLGMLRASDDELATAPQPSLRHLDQLVASVRDAGLPVELRLEGDERPLPPGVDLSAYRIVQEALTNALKYAGPARARVVVRYGSDEIELEVSDDGVGPAPASGNGHGLAGMRERIAVYGGTLESGARVGGGYSIRARLPL
jgi:signal transduction histidine kinase